MNRASSRSHSVFTCVIESKVGVLINLPGYCEFDFLSPISPAGKFGINNFTMGDNL